MFRIPTRRRLAGLSAGVLLVALAGCGGSDEPASNESSASAPAPPVAETSGTPTIGGTNSSEEADISGSDQMVELGARARVAYDCAKADPVVANMVDTTTLDLYPAGEGNKRGDQASSPVDFVWRFGGKLHSANPDAGFGVALFATEADAIEDYGDSPDDDTIRYGKTVIEFGDLTDDNGDTIDTSAFVEHLHRCFDLAGDFD